MSEHTQPNTLDMMSWNVKAGGFDKHNSTKPLPEWEAQIQGVVNDFHAGQDSSAITLIDANKWDTHYGGNSGIANHLGYPDARFVRVNDENQLARGYKDIGIAFATDRRIARGEPLDLDTSQGLKIVLDIGRYGLQIANVYFNDLSEDTRLNQARALIAGLEADVPTLLVGDFNALRPDMKGASIGVKTGDLAVRSLALLLPKRTELGKSIKGMNERLVTPFIESLGYKDADSRKRPTAPVRPAPIFGVDYAFHNNGVATSNFRTLPAHGASDHRPIAFEAKVL